MRWIMFLLLLLPAFAQAQQFDWGLTSSGVSVMPHASVVDKYGNLHVIGEYYVSDWFPNRCENTEHVVLHQREGENIQVRRNSSREGESFMYICYSAEGQIIKYKDYSRDYMQLKALDVDEEGNVVILALLQGFDKAPLDQLGPYLGLEKVDLRALLTEVSEKQQPLVDPKKEDRDEETSEYDEYYGIETNHPNYLWLMLELDGTGTVTGANPVNFDQEHAERLDIKSMKGAAGGGYYVHINAGSGEVVAQKPLIKPEFQTEYIIKLSKEGAIEWYFPVQYLTKSGGGLCSPAVMRTDPRNGNVYFMRTFKDGVIVEGKQYDFPKNLKRKSSDPMGMYLLCISPKGKLQWMTLSEEEMLFGHDMAVTDDHIFISATRFDSTNTLFGRMVDTSLHRKNAILKFSKRGKYLDARTHNFRNHVALSPAVDGSIVFAANMEYTRSFWHRIFLSDTADTVGHYGWLGVLSPDSLHVKYKLQVLFEPEDDEPCGPYMMLTGDNCNHYYWVGQIFFGLPLELQWWWEPFNKGCLSGGGIYVAKADLNLPIEAAKKYLEEAQIAAEAPNAEETVCIASPGPVQLKAYPNPFSHDLTITYRTAFDDKLDLELYNMSGQLAHTFFTGKAHETGNYTTVFLPPGGLQPGTYILVLRGSTSRSVQEVVLVR